ncbi:hypothetical protein ACHQM5_009844 [Ranunculus cassubicifolius]
MYLQSLKKAKKLHLSLHQLLEGLSLAQEISYGQWLVSLYFVCFLLFVDKRFLCFGSLFLMQLEVGRNQQLLLGSQLYQFIFPVLPLCLYLQMVNFALPHIHLN